MRDRVALARVLRLFLFYPCLICVQSVANLDSTIRMSDPYFQELFADRIGGVNYGKGTEIYKFEKIKRAKRKALADFPNRSLIDFGIGENDGVAPESVRRKMTEEINKPENRGYMDNGN